MSGFGPVLSDPAEQEKLYTDDLGIAFEEVYDDYRFTEHLMGTRHFSLMPLSRLSQSLFGKPAWPADVTVPQAWVEFEVDDIDAATQELEDRGYTLLVRARHEPWGQVITRLITDTGLMVGIVRNPEE
jgi:hypothetical protein